MSELERFTALPEATRKTRKALAGIDQAEMIQLASQAAAARQQARVEGAAESLRLARSQARLTGTYHLAEVAVNRATTLNRIIATSARGNPGLELIHRSIEETAATVAGLVIYQYGVGQ